MVNFDQINNYGSLFLTNLHEPSDNSLTIEVKESFTSPIPQNVEISGKTFTDCYKVSVNEYGPGFKISFINYVSYQVLNESFYSFNDRDNYIAGKYSTFRVYSQSAYLDYILKETYADIIFPNEIKHFALYCSNHIIHIISLNDPIITADNILD